jgi:hypothetical protein
VTLSPSSKSLALGGTQLFTATVGGTTNTALNWYVNGALGGNAAQGKLTACTTVTPRTCTYTAPAINVPSPNPAVIKVASQADPSKFATARVTVTTTIVVTISPTSKSLALGGTQVFTATISHTTNTALNWYVNGALGGNAAQGKLTACTTVTPRTCTYTAPAVNVPSPNPAVIEVASQADPSKSATANVAVTTTIAVTLSPSSKSLALGGTQLFTATISKTTNTALNWYVNGVHNGNATQGTLTACTTVAPLTCTYTAPPLNVPNPNPAVIKVASAADPSKFATASVTVTTAGVCESGNESVLNGQYAFNLIGYKANGFTARVGSFTADGAGHITGGELDHNSAGGSSGTITLSPSTYTVGADNRGCVTFTATAETFTTRFDLGVISSGTATQGRIMEFDPPTSSAFIATGEILKQTPSNFSGGLNGGYVHLLTGWDTTNIASSFYAPNGGRIACDGVKTASGNGASGGTFTNGEQFCNDEGVAPSGPTTGLSGTYSKIDANGRLTETVGTSHIVAYMVSTGQLLSLTTDSNPVMAGEAFQQSGGPFGQSSLNGQMVAYANGVNNSTSGKIYFALVTANGSTAGFSQYYEDDGGYWNYNGEAGGNCTFTMAANGALLGCGKGGVYLTAANTWVYVGSDIGGFAGYATPQTGPSGGFTAASVAGTFFGGTSDIVNQNAQAEGDIVSLSGSGTNVSGTSVSDETSTNYQQADDVETISGATLGSNGTITQTKNGTKQVQGIAIDTTHFFIANHTDSSYPTISVFGPSIADKVAVSITSPKGAQKAPVNGTVTGITVSVTHTSNTGLTWTFNGLAGGSGYGTISGSYPTFTYKAPSTVPSPATFNVTATSNADVSKTASLSITITGGAGVPPLSITTTSLPDGEVGVSYSAALSATGGKTPYTWSISSGTFPSCLSLSSTGSITGTPAASCEGMFNFTIKVADSSSPTQSQTRQFTITISPASSSVCESGNESVLSGQYAFSLSGFNATGYLAAVGSFTADGSGHITAGEVDSNGALGVQHANITTSGSSYSVGSDNRGCATVVTPFYTFKTRFALGTVSSDKATEGRMIEWETGSSAYIAAGRILQQTAPTAVPSGSYAFKESGVDGNDSNGRMGGVGVMSASRGSLSAGEVDMNDAGSMQNITGMTGSYTSADSNGRFTMTVAVPSVGTSHVAAYMVSSSQFLFMTTDAEAGMGILTGEMQQQSTPEGGFSETSVNGNMVTYTTTGHTGDGYGDVQIGLVIANGRGSLTGSMYEDKGGTWKTPNPGTGTCPYSVASNGRMTLGGGCGGVLYLTAANTGLVLGSGKSVNIGQVEPQVGSNFTTASLSGTFYIGTLEAGNQPVNTGVGVVTMSGSGGYSTTSDYTSTTGQTPDGTDTGTVTVNSNGTFSTSDHPGVIIGIVISRTKSVIVDNESDPYPTIEIIKR